MSLSEYADLQDNQIVAIEAISGGATRIQAATLAGINVRTLHRWLNDETFSNALEDYRTITFNETHDKLIAATTTAILTLEEIAGNKQSRDIDRVNASKTILESVLRYRELRSVISRLEILEDEISQQNTGFRSTVTEWTP